MKDPTEQGGLWGPGVGPPPPLSGGVPMPRFFGGNKYSDEKKERERQCAVRLTASTAGHT
eukprot:scaffold14038_cov110-Isochrysis_galbana.AAC.3